jgi:hypothetical protein
MCSYSSNLNAAVSGPRGRIFISHCPTSKLQNLVLEQEELLHAILLVLYTIYSHTKFHVSSSNSSLNIDIKMKINVDFAGQRFS